MRVFAHNVIFMSEYQKPGTGRMESHVYFRQSDAYDAAQEQFVIVIIPNMYGVELRKTIPVAVNRVHIEYCHIHGMQYLLVDAYIRRIPIHETATSSFVQR